MTLALEMRPGFETVRVQMAPPVSPQQSPRGPARARRLWEGRDLPDLPELPESPLWLQHWLQQLLGWQRDWM